MPAATERRMSNAFGHNFSHVRIFSDSAAAEATRAAGAKAYAVDSDIYFNDSFYNPGSENGDRLLAHELTHVVQAERFGTSRGRPISESGDPAEREAKDAAERVAAGQPALVSRPPSATVSRSVLDWAENEASSAASAAGGAAGAAWSDAKSDGAWLRNSMRANRGYVDKGKQLAGNGIDWLENKEQSLTSSAVSEVKGIPVLEQVAEAGKFVNDEETELTGGVLRGAAGMVGGLADLAADPYDAARGVETMAEHIPLLPGMPNPLKTAHGLLNVAMGDETWGQLGASANPLNSAKDDYKFWGKVAGGVAGQYSKQWKDGKYADVVGHAAFDIGSLLFGAGEANAAGKVGEAAEVTDAAKLGDAADLAKAGDAADLSKAGDAAGLAQPANVSDAADLSKAGDAADVNKAGGGGQVSEPPSGGGGDMPEPLDNPAHNAADFEKLKQSYSQQEIMGAEPVGSARKGGSDSDIPDGMGGVLPRKHVDAHHTAAIFEQSRIAEDSRVFPIQDGKTLTQMRSGVNGRDGIVEYIVDKKGNLVHQRFIKGGDVNGVYGGRPDIRPNKGSYYPGPDDPGMGASNASSNGSDLGQPAALRSADQRTLRPIDQEALRPVNQEALRPVDQEALRPVDNSASNIPGNSSPVTPDQPAADLLDNPADGAADFERLKAQYREQEAADERHAQRLAAFGKIGKKGLKTVGKKALDVVSSPEFDDKDQNSSH